MKEKLLKLLENSYSPYCHFRVTAIAMNPEGKTKVHLVSELCPYPFNDEDLKIE